MERLRLWRYKKLTNEIVKEKVIEKPSDDEDYNSCFRLGKTLKSSCLSLIMKEETKQVAADDFTSGKAEEKIMKKLREQRQDELEGKEHRKTFQKCLHKILNRNRTRQAEHKLHEEPARDAYAASGIYERFGSSCVESLKSEERVKREVEAEDLRSASWFHSGLLGNFSVEMLEHQAPGSFIIHRASLKSKNFILSLRVLSTSTKVVHHLIVHSKQGYRLKGAKKVFSTVTSLVTHHSVMSEMLPLTLSLQKTYSLTKEPSESDDFCPLEDLPEVFTGLEL